MKTLYYNGNLLPLDGSAPKQAMLVEDGLLQAVGQSDALMQAAGDAKRVDLQGRTVLPGFVDAHSHLSGFAHSFLQASLETAASFDDVLALLRAFAKKNGLQAGQWLIANGYDHNRFAEKAHPTKALLDAAFPGLNVVLQHQSGHFGVFNSAALDALELSGTDHAGYLEETAFVEAAKRMPLPNPEQLLAAYREAQHRYASYGVTTVQEGMMVRQMLPIYTLLMQKKALFLDVVGYPQLEDADALYEALPGCAFQAQNHFRLGGIKLLLDGSPQGRTAWMKTPYRGSDSEYGVSSQTDEAVTRALKTAIAHRWQLLTHCNGDAAAEQLLRCAEGLFPQEQAALAALRPVIIHAQLLEREQLPRVKALGFIPSFFVAHCAFWGDTHIENFGKERAEQISPAGSALRLGIPFTFHQDTPVLPPDMLQTVWCAATRVTRSGIVLGASERIPVAAALRAVTANAAYQYGEEATKGTLSAGKRADFVVLDRSPLEVPVEELPKIQVLATFKDGTQIYSR